MDKLSASSADFDSSFVFKLSLSSVFTILRKLKRNNSRNENSALVGLHVSLQSPNKLLDYRALMLFHIDYIMEFKFVCFFQLTSRSS